MKKPEVDYRQLRLSTIHEPRFSHLRLLLGWVGFFLLFYLTERFIPAEKCFVVWCRIDDWIPFWEGFLIPYVFWYFLIAFSLVYFLLYHVESFKKLQTYIIITQVVAMVIYIIFPTRQDLRPDVFPRDNFLTQGVAFLYSVDTNTGVCPSLHVALALGIASVWLKEKEAHLLWKVFVVLSAILICLSTVFIKQHSVLDALAGIALSLAGEHLVYKKRSRQ